MAKEGVYQWSFIDRASISVINLATNLVLARLLTEGDLGLLVLVALFTTIAADLTLRRDKLIHFHNSLQSMRKKRFVSNLVGIIFRSVWNPAIAGVATAAVLTICHLSPMIDFIIAGTTFGLITIALSAASGSGLYIMLRKKILR